MIGGKYLRIGVGGLFVDITVRIGGCSHGGPFLPMMGMGLKRGGREIEWKVGRKKDLLLSQEVTRGLDPKKVGQGTSQSPGEEAGFPSETTGGVADKRTDISQTSFPTTCHLIRSEKLLPCPDAVR